jgi:hypothetical protein
MFNRIASISLIIIGICIILFCIILLIVPFIETSAQAPFFPNTILTIACSIVGALLGFRITKKGWSLWTYLKIDPELLCKKGKNLDQLTETEKDAVLAVGLFNLILILIVVAGIGYELLR